MGIQDSFSKKGVNQVSKLTSSSILEIFLILGTIGYFVYDKTFAGVFFANLAWWAIGITAVLTSLIPFAGVFIYGFITGPAVMHYLSGATEMPLTFLTTIYYWIGIVLGAIITFLTSVFVLSLIRE